MWGNPFITGPGDSLSSGGAGPSGFVGRDIIWVDLRFPGGIGNNGTDELPYNTANLGIGNVPDGGTLNIAGGDASTEPGIAIDARSLSFVGFSGQKTGGLPPVLPTLTFAITTGTQRLAFRNISVALVHSGTAASLSAFDFYFCPSVTLTSGSDASPINWTGDAGCTFSGSGGAAVFQGGTIAGYTANSGAIVATGCRLTSDITSPTSITLTGACTFGGAISVTAPTINVDLATHALAILAGVTFSTAVIPLYASAAPSDIGTSNTTGTDPRIPHLDHGHALTYPVVQTVIGGATSALSLNTQRISNLAAPVSANDAARLADVQAAAAGLKIKDPAVVAATSNQGTLSGTAQTIDGVALNTIGQRALLTAQSTATQNGLWVVQSGAWTRPTDFATGSSASQAYVRITGGSVPGRSYVCTSVSGSDVVDTNNLSWVIFSDPPTITAGAGLTLTGSTIDFVAGDATLVVNANEAHVGVIGNANLADNTIALARLANASATAHFLMRKTAGAGAWEDGTATDARTALSIFESPGWQAVRVATTGNITLSGTQTIDGVACIANDRVLAWQQTTGSQNGLYVVAAGAWSRALDATSSSQFWGGKTVAISEGTQGNRVAFLTTDDPITVGSTTLTFDLTRIAPLASVAPADITNGAAQIGTDTTAARAGHVHTLTATVLLAVLATAAASVSVNSQKITNLATPTLSTDAATKGYVDGATYLTAGNGLTRTGATIDVVANADGTIVANANDIQVGTLIAANYAANTIALTKLANAAAQFDLVGRKTAAGGAWEDCTPAQLQLPTYSRQIIAGTGLTGGGDLSADRTLTLGTVANSNLSDNTIALARLVNASAQNHFIMRKTAAAGAWEDGSRSDALTGLGIAIGTSGKFSYSDGTSLGSTTTYTTDGTSLIGLTSIQQTGTPSATGWLRGTNGSLLMGRGAGAFDVFVAYLDVAGGSGNERTVYGDPTRSKETALNFKTGGSVGLYENNVLALSYDTTSGLDLKTHAVKGVTSVSFGTGTQPAAGLNRIGYVSVAGGGVTLMQGRTEGDTTTVNLGRWNVTTNALQLGDGASGSGTDGVTSVQARMRAGGTGWLVSVGGSDRWITTDTQHDAKSLDIVNVASVSQSGGTASASGWLRGRNNVTLLAAKAAGSGDFPLVATDSSDIGYFGVANLIGTTGGQVIYQGFDQANNGRGVVMRVGATGTGLTEDAIVLGRDAHGFCFNTGASTNIAFYGGTPTARGAITGLNVNQAVTSIINLLLGVNLGSSTAAGIGTVGAGGLVPFGCSSASAGQFLVPVPAASKLGVAADGTEANVRWTAPCAGILAAFSGYAASTSTLTVRKNGVDQTLAVSSNNAYVRDSSHTVTVAGGDFVTVKTSAGVLCDCTMVFTATA